MVYEDVDLSNPKFYYNRELSWMEFNKRVLEEAQDKNNLPLERLKFLAITASNLDEFFMVRISGIKQLVYAKFKGVDITGKRIGEQYDLLTNSCHSFMEAQYTCLNRSIVPSLEKENIFFRKYDELKSSQKAFLERYFTTTLYPILTPMAVDQSHPFPLLNNKSINFIVKLEDGNGHKFAIMQVPTVVSRFVELPESDEGIREFIFLENIIKEFIHYVFLGHKVLEANVFRVTRNSDLSFDEEETDDLLKEIEKSLKSRKWGEPIRLEINKKMDKDSSKFLEKKLQMEENEVYRFNGCLDLSVFMKFVFLDNFEYLRNADLEPQPVKEFENKNIFDAINEKDILVHHPFDSFDCVVNFVEEAAVDEGVLAIKQTLYRVSGNSPIVNALIRAAENGKQVTVMVELKARFDEENNIVWARKLENAGCHVVYGLVGLKTHCKVCLVVRKEEDGIRRYVHLGTGNYNDSTAKIYTDFGLFTAKDSFGVDVSALFNVITGYSDKKEWNKISVAPITLRKTMVDYINREINHAENGRPAEIIFKMNSLVDPEMIECLYKASMAGVKIKLIVRGMCCLKTGIEGVSENIQVVSIIDRFLEHSRIYYFKNGDEPKVLLSSADLMPRNLNKRVEVAFPIDDNSIKAEIMEIIKIILSDTEKLRIQDTDGQGGYSRVDKRGKAHIQSQLEIYKRTVDSFQRYTTIKNKDIFKPVTTNTVEE